MSDVRLPLGLAPLTLGRPADPVAFVAAAAGAGFAAVGLTVQAPGASPAPWATATRLDRLAAELTARALSVTDVGVVTLAPGADPDLTRRASAAAAAVGAPVLIVLDDDPDAARAQDALARVVELAGSVGVRAAVEFMPYSAAPDLAAARRLVAGTGAGIVFDVFQHQRGGGGPDDLDAADPVVLVQLADGTREPAADLRREALTDRRPPGLGDFDLAAYLARVPPGVPVTVETPWRAMAALPLLEQARIVARTTATLLSAPSR